MVDVGLVVVCAATGVWREVKFPGDDLRLFALPVAIYAVVQVAGALSLLQRRHHPAAVGAFNAALCLVSPVQASFVAAYSLGAHGDKRRTLPVFAVLLGSWAIGAPLWRLDDPITGPVVLVAAMLLGLYLGARRALYQALVERAERAELDRQDAAERAVAAERARLAAEMHDVIAHEVTLIVLQAGALAITDDRPEVHAAAEEIRRRGVAALDELHQLVRVLRRDEVAPPSLAALVAAATTSGLEIELREQGDPPSAPATRRMIHRIAQESLTNSAKHSAGNPVTIDVDYRPTATVIEVGNTLAVGAADNELRRVGSGVGLSSLTDQLRRCGGDLHAGVEGARFVVVATVPNRLGDAERRR